jgi:hypothetical protein
MSQTPYGQHEAGRGELRARVSELRSECLALHRLLPGDEPWHGPASAAFRLRVASLRARLDAACVALEIAEVEL